MESPIKALLVSVKWPFWSMAVFTATLAVLSANGFTPEASSTEAYELGREEVVIGEVIPTRIVINAIGVDAPIVNPQNRDVSVLDAALMDGVVRYPGSADLSGSGNMLLFGHSSGRPVVHNQMFKVFNGLRELEGGDIISVQSGSHENIYRVTKVIFAKEDDVSVAIAGTDKKLILSSCDSFQGKSDRVIVEADFVESIPLDGQLIN